MPRPRKPASPFRYFNSSPEVIRLAVLMYVKYPLSLRNVEDLLHERGIDISHETVRHWWNRFGPLFAADIQRQRVSRMRGMWIGVQKGPRYRGDRRSIGTPHSDGLIGCLVFQVARSGCW